ncbi:MULTISPECIES: ZIP family metal transporter [Atopobiaceae]|uniref:ZIP family metal transporter n=1 Tax=Atopobiaceae TaxID=1643824 RepID=UPI000B39ECC9|nr:MULTISPECIES: ZIP family metal transporter [Atopobiaceae]MCR8908541.1 ZIP family metal transporter [Thermophilibacter sp. ET337]OUO33289.1 ZIP zinc transporter [Olsenella sp. An293]
MFENVPQALTWAALGCGFTWLMTTAGSAVVFFFRSERKLMHHIFLGFAAGVMVAASVWSLLNPAIEQAEGQGVPGWLPAAGGFLLGVAFLMALDTLLPHLHAGSEEPEGVPSGWKRTTLLVSAVTLHNIPEGMSVGLLFAMAAQSAGAAGETYLGMAFALAAGIGLQNFPEGAAISLPLAREGMSRRRAFLAGSLSGIVEPIFGVAVVLASGWISPYMPWLLAFAAGAMIYVVVEELIPEAHLGEHSNVGTLGFIVGFVVMMVLDVALG